MASECLYCSFCKVASVIVGWHWLDFCRFYGSSFCILLMPHYPRCVLLVLQCLLLLDVPIVLGNFDHRSLCFVFHRFCVNVISVNLNKYNYVFVSDAWCCCGFSSFVGVHCVIGEMCVDVYIPEFCLWFFLVSFLFDFGWSDILAQLFSVSFLCFIWFWKMLLYYSCCELWPGDVVSFIHLLSTGNPADAWR